MIAHLGARPDRPRRRAARSNPTTCSRRPRLGWTGALALGGLALHRARLAGVGARRRARHRRAGRAAHELPAAAAARTSASPSRSGSRSSSRPPSRSAARPLLSWVLDSARHRRGLGRRHGRRPHPRASCSRSLLDVGVLAALYRVLAGVPIPRAPLWQGALLGAGGPRRAEGARLGAARRRIEQPADRLVRGHRRTADLVQPGVPGDPDRGGLGGRERDATRACRSIRSATATGGRPSCGCASRSRRRCAPSTRRRCRARCAGSRADATSGRQPARRRPLARLGSMSSRPLRIASVNVNGVRAAFRKGMGDWLAGARRRHPRPAGGARRDRRPRPRCSATSGTSCTTPRPPRAAPGSRSRRRHRAVDPPRRARRRRLRQRRAAGSRPTTRSTARSSPWSRPTCTPARTARRSRSRSTSSSTRMAERLPELRRRRHARRRHGRPQRRPPHPRHQELEGQRQEAPASCPKERAYFDRFVGDPETTAATTPAPASAGSTSVAGSPARSTGPYTWWSWRGQGVRHRHRMAHRLPAGLARPRRTAVAYTVDRAASLRRALVATTRPSSSTTRL